MNNQFAVAFPARDAFYYGLTPDFYHKFETFRKIYETASNIMGEDLYKISYEYPNKKEEYHTVCLITHCYGLYSILLENYYKPSASLGFSQGEFTAVVAAGSAQFVEVIKLVYELELLLSKNDVIMSGTMARVFELDRESLRKCCRQIDPEGNLVDIAIELSANQNVISGNKEKINMLAGLVKKNGARWVIPVGNGGAFHSPLCRDIIMDSKTVFNKYCFEKAQYPVFSCTDGNSSIDGGRIKSMLSQQIAAPIRWDRVINNLSAKRIKRVLEIGPGCTISGNTRIINPDIKCHWINSLEDFNAVIGRRE
ncbi:MAG: ACP S-malonyltransferase [Bacillota bacterium]